MKKAYELSVLCGCEVGLIMFTGKYFICFFFFFFFFFFRFYKFHRGINNSSL